MTDRPATPSSSPPSEMSACRWCAAGYKQYLDWAHKPYHLNEEREPVGCYPVPAAPIQESETPSACEECAKGNSPDKHGLHQMDGFLQGCPVAAPPPEDSSEKMLEDLMEEVLGWKWNVPDGNRKLAKLRKAILGGVGVINALTRELEEARENLQKAYRFEESICAQLIGFAGETGESEGAADVLKRKLQELAALRAEVSRIASENKWLNEANDNLAGQVETLTQERVVLAMLSADEPQFTNPLAVYVAKDLRDEILRLGAAGNTEEGKKPE